MFGYRLLILAAVALPAYSWGSSFVTKPGDVVSYFVPSKLELAYDFKVEEPLPVTVITSTEETNTVDWLNSTIYDFLAKDDVYSNDFSPAFFLQGPQDVHLADDTSKFIENLGAKVVYIGASLYNITILDGPYFATCSGLHRAWRLYDDFTNSFVLPTIPSAGDSNTYEPLQANSGNPYGALSVAVSSRLFYTVTPEQPLAGYRIGVKDEYDLKGTLTTYGSRSYAITYPPANQT